MLHPLNKNIATEVELKFKQFLIISRKGNEVKSLRAQREQFYVSKRFNFAHDQLMLIEVAAKTIRLHHNLARSHHFMRQHSPVFLPRLCLFIFVLRHF